MAMKIPKYWAQGVQSAKGLDGRNYMFSCWQWSNVSVADAQQQANARALGLVQRLANDEDLDRYSYGDRPLREEIRQAVTNRQGKEIALVTRNAYGALVLNAAQAMFIDIDFPGKGTGNAAPLKRLFGGAQPDPETLHCQRVEAWAAQHPDLGINIYRTFGGLRCLITNVPFDPARGDALDILQDLKSDPLYVRLCQAQECFRARLTPKPWRCGITGRPPRYPWADIALEALSRQWEQQYDAASASYAVCRLLKRIGPAEVHPDIEPVLSLHDRMACSAYSQQLA
jgi:hypothetical protein